MYKRQDLENVIDDKIPGENHQQQKSCYGDHKFRIEMRLQLLSLIHIYGDGRWGKSFPGTAAASGDRKGSSSRSAGSDS